METAVILGKVIFSIAAGALAGIFAVYAFNRIPPKWFCDYGEEPDRGMWGVRIRNKPWTTVFILVFTAACLKMLEQGFLYAVPGLASLWLLLLIGIADKKYMIIPDQLVILLAAAAFGFIPFHASWQSHLIGALTGGGCILLLGIIGKILFRKEAMGFGDVKLFAAIGLLLGLKGVVTVLILTVFSSAFVFGIGLIRGSLKAGDVRPLGPFIAASAALYIIFRREFLILTDLYFR